MHRNGGNDMRRRKLTPRETTVLGAAIGAATAAAMVALLATAGLVCLADPQSVGTPFRLWLPVLISGALVGGLLARWGSEARWSIVPAALVGCYFGAFALPALVVILWPLLGAGPLPASEAPLVLLVGVVEGALVGASWYRSSAPTDDNVIRILAVTVLTATVLIALVRDPDAGVNPDPDSSRTESPYPYP